MTPSLKNISFKEGINNVATEERHVLYIDTAESTLNKNWQCESMNTLLQDF
ncbi:hypothetical protein MNBD_GAMMA10-2486 [hydrothermal vent metagenome]|uniref:Uncharacterized protein n=1 Tax=hydrothermal vent metagenome TaxID=652676 RepID=A0A3B0Y2S9_9ZZZZ